MFFLEPVSWIFPLQCLLLPYSTASKLYGQAHQVQKRAAASLVTVTWLLGVVFMQPGESVRCSHVDCLFWYVLDFELVLLQFLHPSVETTRRRSFSLQESDGFMVGSQPERFS